MAKYSDSEKKYLMKKAKKYGPVFPDIDETGYFFKKPILSGSTGQPANEKALYAKLYALSHPNPLVTLHETTEDVKKEDILGKKQEDYLANMVAAYLVNYCHEPNAKVQVNEGLDKDGSISYLVRLAEKEPYFSGFIAIEKKA